MTAEFRHLPGVDKVLSDERLVMLAKAYPHDLLVDLVRESLESERAAVAAGKPASTAEKVAASVAAALVDLATPGLRRVINASGVILHTNLGRAPLSPAALKAMEAVSRGYANLEFDLESGGRGSRQVHVEGLLCRLSGAEAALVVNNNAAAVLLGLTALARR